MLIDSYLSNAIEVDVDAICDGKDVFIAASWSTSRKRASIRATRPCSLPPYSLKSSVIAELERQAKVMALALKSWA